jgi:hypothetical protein
MWVAQLRNLWAKCLKYKHFANHLAFKGRTPTRRLPVPPGEPEGDLLRFTRSRCHDQSADYRNGIPSVIDFRERFQGGGDPLK